MLAELTLLLHEMTDSLRGRLDGGRGGRPQWRSAPVTDGAAEGRVSVVAVSGLASPGKARLVAALRQQLAPAGISVHATGDAPAPEGPVGLRVHAETDLEALVEGGLHAAAVREAAQADLVVPVDWEATSRSVRRVSEALIALGVAAHDAGT